MATKKMAPTRPSKCTINALSLVATGEYGEELLEASKRIEESRQRDSGRVKSPKSSADKKLKELRAALRVVLARLDELLSLDGQPLLPRSFQVARFIHQAAILAETGPRRGAPKKPTTDNANKRSTAGRPITITTKELQQLRDDLAQTISEHGLTGRGSRTDAMLIIVAQFERWRGKEITSPRHKNKFDADVAYYLDLVKPSRNKRGE